MATPAGGWRGFIAGLAPVWEDGIPRLRPVGPGATEEALASLESTLGVALPADLRNLLAEMNGVYDAPGYLQLIMSVEELFHENDREWKNERAARASGAEAWKHGIAAPDAVTIPFDQLFYFAGRGNGDLFGFPIENESVRDDRVFDWDHEMGEMTPFASSLRDFLVQWAAMTADW